MLKWSSFLRRIPLLLACLLCAVTLLGAPHPATAQDEAAAAEDLTAAVQKLAGDDNTEVSNAVTALALSNNPQAVTILRALRDSELQFGSDGRAYINKDGSYTNAVTGEAAQAPESAKTVQLSNIVRRALAPAIGRLQLRSKDTDIRLDAAIELGKTPTPELLPAMRDALTRETDGDVKEKLEVAVAQIDIDSDDPVVRLSAVRAIHHAGAVQLRDRVARLLAKDDQGNTKETDAAVRSEAEATLGALETKLFFFTQIANMFYGVSLGSVLLLAALGLAITFGLMRVINMAHGEMLMLGAYTTFMVQNLFQKYAPAQIAWYLVAAVPAAFVVTALVGMALERGILRFLYGRPLETLLATWGISLCLIQTVRMVFGAANVTVANPSWLSGGWELLPDIVLPYTRLAIIVFVCVVVAFVWFMLQKTRLGLYVRAVTQNREMASNMGIPTQRIDMWTFGLGSGVAGLGGVALSQIGNVGPELGQGYIVDSFMVVVLGGVGKLAGTIAGAMGLGIVNKFLEPISGAVLGKIFVLVFVILFIQKRPQGIFALKGRAAEL